MEVPVIKAGNKYEVIDDFYRNFMPGEIVVAIESCQVPYCVREAFYCKDKAVIDYSEDQFAALMDTELKEV